MDPNHHGRPGKGFAPAPTQEDEGMNQYQFNPTAPSIPNPPTLTVGVPVPSPFPGGYPYDRQKELLQQRVKTFWARQMKEMEESSDLKSHSLPLSRIKKIMKADGDVKMVSSEATMLLAKACELFIMELTMRSWAHVEDDKRKIIKKIDVASAISMNDMFDFLVDVVPRDDTVMPGHHQLIAPFIAPTPNQNAPYPYMLLPHHVPWNAPTTTTATAPENAPSSSSSNPIPDEQHPSNSDHH